VHEWSVLLEQERYREKKRQNDVEEGLVAPVAVLEDVLGRGVSAMIPILDGLPLVMKRHWPEITGDQIRLVKEAIAECRNALADVEITLDDD
jgi:phage terminase Nu1 subunit (DNA packaging protein)